MNLVPVSTFYSDCFESDACLAIIDFMEKAKFESMDGYYSLDSFKGIIKKNGTAVLNKDVTLSSVDVRFIANNNGNINCLMCVMSVDKYSMWLLLRNVCILFYKPVVLIYLSKIGICSS